MARPAAAKPCLYPRESDVRPPATAKQRTVSPAGLARFVAQSNSPPWENTPKGSQAPPVKAAQAKVVVEPLQEILEACGDGRELGPRAAASSPPKAATPAAASAEPKAGAGSPWDYLDPEPPDESDQARRLRIKRAQQAFIKRDREESEEGRKEHPASKPRGPDNT